MQPSQRLVLPIIQAQERVYCQIVDRNITALNCSRTQGQSECFACAAPSRVCEQCKKRHVAVSVIGLCSVCLSLALQAELGRGKPEYRLGDRVYCQMVRKEINTSTCFKMQGASECRDCPAPSRRCEKCDNRPAAIARAGFCLHCIVQEYGDGWNSLTNAELTDALREEQQQDVLDESNDQAVTTPMSHDIEKTNTNGLGEDMATTIAADQDMETIETAGEDTIVVGMKSIREKQDAKMANPNHILHTPPKRDNLHPELIRRGRELVSKYEYASVTFLQTYLQISYNRARQLLDHLTDEGIVGPPNGNKARTVNIRNTPDVSETSRTPIRPKPVPGKRTFTQMVDDARTFILTSGDARTQEIQKHIRVSGTAMTAIMQTLENEGILSTTRHGRGNTRSILVPLLSFSSPAVDPPVSVNSSDPRAARIQRMKDFAAFMGEQSEFVQEVLVPAINDLSLLESIIRAMEQSVPQLYAIFMSINAGR